jgi:hypothetical protein
MGLGNPAALWLLLLVVALLLARRRRPSASRPVGNMYLWSQAAPRSSAAFVPRLQRNWITAVQIAALVAGIVALARPLFPLAASDAVLILDVSASMGARDGSTTRLDLARARAISILDGLPAGTRVQLVRAGAAPEQSGRYQASDPALRREVQAISPTAGRADLAAAVEVVRAAAATEPMIYVLSDQAAASRLQATGQVGAAGDSDQGSKPSARDSRLQWITVGRPADNAAITRLTVRRLPTSPADAQALVETWNYGSAELDASIEIGQGSEVVRQPVRLRARQAATLVVDLEDVGDVVSARLVVSDSLDVDNVRFAVTAPVDPVRVLLVNGSFFLDKALSANTALAVERVSAEAASAGIESQGSYDVIVCESCAEAPDGSAAVLMVPGSAGPDGSLAELTLSSPAHAIAEAVDLSGVRAAVSRDLASQGEVIARALGRPALVAYEQNGRRVVELGFHAAGGELPLSTAFPVLIANVIDWLAASRENALEVAAGDTLQWRIASGQGQEPPTIVTPDGRSSAPTVAQGRLSFGATEAAGVYRVVSSGRQQFFAVNPATDTESNLSASGATSPEPRDEAAPSPAVVSRRGEMVTPWLLLCLVLVTIEWWLRAQRNQHA